jgi:hypothetical protein
VALMIAHKLLPTRCVEEDLLLAEVGLDSFPTVTFRAELSKALEGRNILVTVLFDRSST